MRVLYLSSDPGVPVLGHKGASVHVRELASALSGLGAQVAIASPRIEHMGDVLDAPVELLPIPPLPTKASEADLRAALESQSEVVVNLARAFGADAIYERYSLFGVAGIRAAECLGIPHVLEVNAPLRAEATRFRTLPHPGLATDIERTVLHGTDRVLPVSQALGRWLEQEGVEPERIEVVPNAVAPTRIAERHGRGDDEFVLGFCGSLKPWHGIEVLLEACSIAFAQEPTLRLEVVGTGPLEQLFHSSDLPADRIRPLGALAHADALDRLRDWDVGVAPYLPLEDFYFSPLKVVEYMAVGLCPVASDLGDLPALLDDGGRGLLVPAGDAARLAAAFLELASDRERAAELGHRAREYVLETHTWEKNARIVLDSLSSSRELAA
jgi:glycosyltransferase involved in cell wall biosynthesis